VWPPPQADAGDLGRLTTVPPRKVWTGHRLVRVVEFLDLPGLLGAEPTDRGTDHVGRPVDRQVRTGCREGRDESEWQQMCAPQGPENPRTVVGFRRLRSGGVGVIVGVLRKRRSLALSAPRPS